MRLRVRLRGRRPLAGVAGAHLRAARHRRQAARVLVGRAEIITPEMEREVKKQVSLLKSTSAETREKARAALQKHGRFYEPILKSVLESETDKEVREQIQKLIDLG